MGHSISITEYDEHRLVIYINEPKLSLTGFISIHRGSATLPAFGATRFFPYKNQSEALEDSLRLARLMSYKAAMAGLHYGGAKASLIFHEGLKKSPKYFKAYAEYINMLHGKFVTGADIGISPADVKLMKKFSPHIVGVNVDPVKYTVSGIVSGIEVALQNVFESKSFSKRTIAIQGLGKIGSGLLDEIYNSAKQVFVADTNRAVLEKIQKKYPRVIAISSRKIHSLEVDVFSPCATHGIINEKTIKELKCKIVAGGANNQLLTPNMGTALYKRNILYMPDYIINAGGLISVVDEYEYPNNNDEKRLEKRVGIISRRLNAMLKIAKEEKISPFYAADEMAKDIMKSYTK